MALEWLKQRFNEVSTTLQGEVSKIRNKSFLEAVVADDGQAIGAYATNVGPHVDQHRTEVGDLWFASSVVDDRLALGKHGCGEQVLRRPDTREAQHDLRTTQLLCSRPNVGGRQLERRAH